MTNVAPEYVAEIIDKFEMSDENKQSGVLGIDGEHYFIFFVFSIPFTFPQFSPFFQILKNVCITVKSYI